MSHVLMRPRGVLAMSSAMLAASLVLASGALASTSKGGANYRADRHATPTVKPRIVGGTPITIDRAPWQVYLRAKDPTTGSFFACGGSILNATTILTAAHCLFDETTGLRFPVSDYTVWAGVSSFDFSTGDATGGQSRSVSSATPHPYYTQPPLGQGSVNDFQDDAALIRLSAPLALNGTTVAAIGLGALNHLVPIGSTATVTGFGRQDPNDTAPPNGRLYELNETVADPALVGPNNAVITVGAAVTGSFCSGDSGGGLTSAGGVIGVVSSTSNCHTGTPNFYTNVTAGEVQQFIRGSAAPPRAPRGGTDIVLHGPDATPSRGDKLTCSPGTWSNGPTFTFTFSDARNGKVLQSGASATYTVTGRSDAGATISCRVAAANAGGVGLTPPTRPAPAVKAAPPRAHYKVTASIAASKSKVRRGKRLTYKVTARNRGNRRLHRVRTCVRLSSRFTVVSRHHGRLSHGSLCWTNRSLRTSHRVRHRMTVRIDRDARLGRFKTRVHVRARPHGRDSAARSVRVLRAAHHRKPRRGGGGVTG